MGPGRSLGKSSKESLEALMSPWNEATVNNLLLIIWHAVLHWCFDWLYWLHLRYHSHKKRKDSLQTRAACSWIFILTWNFRGGWGDSASTFFKIASASWFWCSQNYNWLFYMLDKDNIISKSVSEAVEKIPTDEKD